MRSFIFGAVSVMALITGCLQVEVTDESALPGLTGGVGASWPGPTTGTGGTVGGGNGGGGEVGNCLPIWDPSDDVNALGRVLVDGSATGVLRPGSINVESVSFWNAEMQVTFVNSMGDADYAVFASPASNGKVVTFAPIYVAYNLTPTGFKVAAYNYKGEPVSWEIPTTTEVAFVAY